MIVLIASCIGLACFQVGMSISGLPEGFNPHKGIKRVFDGRRKAIESGEGVDWGFAEALAFGTLVSEGRLAGPAFGFVLYTGRSHWFGSQADQKVGFEPYIGRSH